MRMAAATAPIIRLIPRTEFDGKDRNVPMSAPQTGSSYGFEAELTCSPPGMPCNPPPWSKISAIGLDTGKLAWSRPLGTAEKQASFGIALDWDSPNFGGPMITAGQLPGLPGWLLKVLQTALVTATSVQ